MMKNGKIIWRKGNKKYGKNKSLIFGDGYANRDAMEEKFILKMT